MRIYRLPLASRQQVRMLHVSKASHRKGIFAEVTEAELSLVIEGDSSDMLS